MNHQPDGKQHPVDERAMLITYWLIICMTIFMVLSFCGASFWVLWILTKLVTK
jgi:nitrate reductase NapE component